MIHTKDSRQIFAILNRTSVTRDERLAILSYINTRVVKSTNDLTPFELQITAGVLYSWDAAGHLEAQVADILSGRRAA
ncbi:MAG: hypothetical protein WBB07_17405 [Mycobacterium sp.]